MKRKLLILLATLMCICTALGALTACGGSHEHTFSTNWSKDANTHYHACTVSGCNERADETSHTFDDGVITKFATKTSDGEKTFTCEICNQIKKEVVKFVAPTAAQVYTARQKVVEQSVEGYNFAFKLGCDLSVLGLGASVDGTYAGQYRLNETTNEEQFKRTTSGLLFFDSTAYTFTKNSQKIKLVAKDDGTIKKCSVMQAEEADSFFINKAVSSLVDAIKQSNINNVKISNSNEYDFACSLDFGANHPIISKFTSLCSKFGTKVAFKNVSFTNPTAIPFYFNINEDGELEDFMLNLDISVKIKAVKVTVSIQYAQQGASTAIAIPTYNGLITNETEISNELSTINSSFNTLKNSNTYSIDMEAKNEFDPAWNKLAIVDKYTGRLYKNTVDQNVWFNHSYQYKAHHETDDSETYKFTLGNINDGSIYLISRKGKNVVTEATGYSADTQFDYMTAPFIFEASSIDCIEKVIDDDKTTYSLHLNNACATSIQTKILEIINSNDAEGVLDVNNYINSDITIKDAEVIVVYVDGELTEISIKTDIKYNPVDGDYVDYNITLTNELNLLINDKITKAQDYTAPSSTGSVIGLSSFTYYIL